MTSRPGVHRDGRVAELRHHQDVLERRQLRCGLIGDGLHGDDAAAPPESVNNDQNLGVAVAQPRHDRARAVPAEERHHHGSEPCAREEERDRLGDHRQAQADAVTRPDTEVGERRRRIRGLTPELGIRPFARAAVIALPHDGGALGHALRPARHRVVREIELAAGPEPRPRQPGGGVHRRRRIGGSTRRRCHPPPPPRTAAGRRGRAARRRRDRPRRGRR